MKTIKCEGLEIEINDNRDFRFVGYRAPRKEDYYYYNGKIDYSGTDWSDINLLCFELIEPPLELETCYFMDPAFPEELDSVKVYIVEGRLVTGLIMLVDLRGEDFITIFNYFNKNKKLPKRVVLKKGKNGNG